MRRIGPALFMIAITGLPWGILNHANETLGGFSLGWFYPLVFCVGAITLSPLSDAWGRRPLLLVYLLTLLLSAFGLAWRPPQMPPSFYLVFWVLQGFSAAGLLSTAKASIVDLTSAYSRTTYLAYITFALVLGIVLGNTMAPYTLTFLKTQPLLLLKPEYFIVAMSAIFGLGVWFYFPASPLPPRTLSTVLYLAFLKKMLTQAHVRVLAFVFFLMQLSTIFCAQLLRYWLRSSFQFSHLQFLSFMALLGFCFMISLFFLLSRLQTLAHVRTLALTSLLLSALLQITLGNVNDASLIWIYAAVLISSSAIAYTCLLSTLSSYARLDQQGWLMSISSATLALAWLVNHFMQQLDTWVGIHRLLLLGGLLFFTSFMVMLWFCFTRKDLTPTHKVWDW